MSTNLPAPAVVPDPAKPWKAAAAAVAVAVLVALRDYFAGHDAISWGGVGYAVGSALVTFVVAYFTKNPQVVKGAGGAGLGG